MTIGEAIKDARIKAGMTQAELAERLGISPQAVSQYERGKKNPRLSTIQKFADALGIDVSDLLDVVKIFSMMELSRAAELSCVNLMNTKREHEKHWKRMI